MAQTKESDDSWKNPYAAVFDELKLDFTGFKDFVPEPDPKTQSFHWRRIETGFKQRVEAMESIRKARLTAEDVLLTNEPEEKISLVWNALGRASRDTPFSFKSPGSKNAVTYRGGVHIWKTNEYRTLGGLEVYRAGLIVLRSDVYNQDQYHDHMRRIVVNANFYLGSKHKLPPYPFE